MEYQKHCLDNSDELRLFANCSNAQKHPAASKAMWHILMTASLRPAQCGQGARILSALAIAIIHYSDEQHAESLSLAQ